MTGTGGDLGRIEQQVVTHLKFSDSGVRRTELAANLNLPTPYTICVLETLRDKGYARFSFEDGLYYYYDEEQRNTQDNTMTSDTNTDETEQELREEIPTLYREYSGLNSDVVMVDEVDTAFDEPGQTCWKVTLSYDCPIDIGIVHGALKQGFDHIDSIGETTVNPDGSVTLYVYEGDIYTETTTLEEV